MNGFVSSEMSMIRAAPTMFGLPFGFSVDWSYSSNSSTYGWPCSVKGIAFWGIEAEFQVSGHTKDVLMDQLTLLQSKMSEVADDVHRNDTDRLLANGRFLEERFGRSALSLDSPATPS